MNFLSELDYRDYEYVVMIVSVLTTTVSLTVEISLAGVLNLKLTYMYIHFEVILCTNHQKNKLLIYVLPLT